MTVSIKVISVPNELIKFEDNWNTLIKKCSKDPFCLSGFIKQLMGFNRSRGWTPLVLVISTRDTIMGISPLTAKKVLGVRFAKFLSGFRVSSSFIVDNQYQEIYMEHIVDFLFKILRCQFVELTMPAESPHLRILRQKCKGNQVYLLTKPTEGHCIIPIESTWDEFERLRGRNFLKKFRKMERHLDQTGPWKISCIKNGEESDVLRRVLDIEKMSWKESWRTQTGMKVDQDLLMICKAAQYTARTEPDFKWSVWFLEFNDQPLAYTLVLQYKKVAFIMKTSYNQRYKRYYPGIYILNEVIRELFRKREVRTIDFLTDLPFHRTWTSTCLPRVRVVMSQKGASSIILSAITKLEDLLRLKLSDIFFLPLTKKEILRIFWYALREGKAALS